ncbi:hypothetical protein GGS21DRAFT_499680 [Xylaria nigripes]|nr:hypothetical protein GGS21DRAFT_499680 [Xylaria nigripes]
MAPLTRRAAKALDTSTKEEPINTTSTPQIETPVKQTAVQRNRRAGPVDDSKAEKENVVQEPEVATSRRGKLGLRIQNNATPSAADNKSPIEVRIPSSAFKTPLSRSHSVPLSQETDASDEANQTMEPLSASRQLEEEASQNLELQSRLRLMESSLESTPLAKAPGSVTAPRSSGAWSFKTAQESPLPQSQTQTDSESVEAEPEDEATPRPAAAKSTHVVFGDDDDVDQFVAAAADKAKTVADANGNGDKKQAEEEEEESDDEAPEAVSTATAAKETLKSARAAIEAAEQLAASTKRKRQARDNLLKQQAETRKRNRETKVNAPGEADEASEGEQNTRPKRQRRSQKLPEVLPEEFLTDSSDNEDDETALKKMVQRPQKHTFDTAMEALAIEGKRPRDEIVGSTRYRVLAEHGDQRLAPKANKHSRMLKEDLLRRGRQRVETNKKRGFFVRQ